MSDNRDSQRSWLHSLLRQFSCEGKRLSQVELQDIAEAQLGHPFPKYTARISELRDDLFPDEAIFCERVDGEAEVWEYWIGPMTVEAKDRYLTNRGEKTISLLTVTLDEMVDLIDAATDGQTDVSGYSTPRLRKLGGKIEELLCVGEPLGVAVRKALA